jgi:hypothetical protein
MDTNTQMITLEKITEKLDEIASRVSNRRDVPQLIDVLRDAVATIARLGSATSRTTPQQRSKVAEGTLGQIAHTLGRAKLG